MNRFRDIIAVLNNIELALIKIDEDIDKSCNANIVDYLDMERERLLVMKDNIYNTTINFIDIDYTKVKDTIEDFLDV